jgi:hypothetical protein
MRLLFSIAGFGYLSSMLHVDAFPGVKNFYMPPGDGDHRSPCPAINMLANHGFVNRNGQDIPAQDLAQSLDDAFGFSFDSNMVLLEAANQALSFEVTSDNVTLIDLEQFYFIEHDASLVRVDSFFDPLAPFDQDLFQQWVALASGQNGTITRQDTIDHRTNVVFNSRRTNPEVFFDLTFGVRLIAGESFFIFLFGKDPELELISVEDLRSAMEENRIPDGFMTRQERGLPILGLTEVASDVFLPPLLAAIGADDLLEPTASPTAVATTAAISSASFTRQGMMTMQFLSWFALVSIAW